MNPGTSAAARGALLPLLAVIAAMACFQVGAAVAKGLFPLVGAVGAASLRLAIAAVLLILLRRPWRNWPADAPVVSLLGLGACTAGATLMFYLALARLPQGIAIALQFLGPLAVAVAASHRARDLIWVALAAAGVWALVGHGALDGKPLDLLGVVWALGAAASWAGYILCGRKAGAAFGGSTAALSVAIAALVVTPVGIAQVGAATLFAPGLLPLAVLVALISTAIPFSLEAYALPRLPARTFAVLTSLEPVFGALSGLFLLHEALSPAQLAGVALVMAAAGGATWTGARAAPALD